MPSIKDVYGNNLKFSYGELELRTWAVKEQKENKKSEIKEYIRYFLKNNYNSVKNYFN